MKKLLLDVIIPQGDPLLYRITKIDGKKKTQVASALVCVYTYEADEKLRYAEILQIFVDRRHRRVGFGKQLVEALQKSFDMLITGFQDSEPPGRELMFKMGFELKKSLKNGATDSLVWRK